MKKLNVIQIIDSLNVGGAEVLAVNITNELAKQPNIESHLCVTRLEGVLKKNIDKEVGFLFLKRNSTVDFSAIIRLKKYIRKHKIHIIHAHGTSSFIAFCIKVIYPKIKVVWHDHYGIDLKCRKVYPIKIFSSFFSQIIVVNSELKAWAIKNLSCKKVVLLNNFPFFKNKDKTTKLLGTNGKRIVCLAAFRPQKDHINLLKAFAILNQNESGWSLHLIGNDNKDAYSKSIKTYITEYQLENDVFLYGVRSDIKHILSQADIGVLASKSEGLPLALLEYGLANLPVLVTDVGECKNVINHNNALVESQNSTKFAKALQLLIENDMIRECVKQELADTVKKEYSIEAGIEKIIKIYNEC